MGQEKKIVMSIHRGNKIMNLPVNSDLNIIYENRASDERGELYNNINVYSTSNKRCAENRC